MIEPQPRPDWSPLPREGCVNVEGRVLLVGDGLAIAMLRFAPNATIDPHAATFPVDVICLEGAGFTAVGDDAAPIAAGQRVRWPPGLPHRLWTEGGAMTTLMIERHARAGQDLAGTGPQGGH